ncbi:MAG: hypothetical protein JWN34_3572 [Bryobacterales bacterium]|jgi:hypothetical protein|nr:hypothetical protein [Bryobacterales bacterium]
MLFRIWNRKVHFYLGLYFLFFTWLFAFTGLILNHQWKFTEFYPNRKITTTERSIRVRAGTPDVATARAVIAELGIRGEISMGAPSAVPGRLDFTASQPRMVHQIQANLIEGKAKVVSNEYNAWGVIHVLHTFTGVSSGNPAQQRDWILTTVWALAMDAVAAGLIVMVLSSYYMWWVLTQKRVAGGIALAAGSALCLLFVFGLRWIY